MFAFDGFCNGAVGVCVVLQGLPHEAGRWVRQEDKKG